MSVIDVFFPLVDLVGWLIEGLETSQFLQQVVMIDGTSTPNRPLFFYQKDIVAINNNQQSSTTMDSNRL